MSLKALVLAGLQSLPVFHEDKAPEFAEQKAAQLETFAAAVAEQAAQQKVALPREWAALMVTIAYQESGLSLRIHRGDCYIKKGECDRGLARGVFQLHRYAEAVPTWDQMHGLDNIGIQARVASARLRRGYYTCRGGTDWLVATINGFAGRRCGSVWPGLESRVATYRAVLKAMSRKAAT